MDGIVIERKKTKKIMNEREKKKERKIDKTTVIGKEI